MIRLGASDLTQSVFEHWSQTVTRLSPTVRRNHMRIVRNFWALLKAQWLMRLTRHAD
jgi:integrase/recombinase XerD